MVRVCFCRHGYKLLEVWTTDECGPQAIGSVIARRWGAGSHERTDLLQHLLDKGHRPDNGVRTNTRDILDQLSELTLAGAETTSATIWYVPFL
jgi:cytochrome P450